MLIAANILVDVVAAVVIVWLYNVDHGFRLRIHSLLGVTAQENYEFMKEKWAKVFQENMRNEQVFKVEYARVMKRIEDLQTFTEGVNRLNRELALDMAIVNVAPIESMDRALDILMPYALDPTWGDDIKSPVNRAIAELKEGLEMVKKNPIIKQKMEAKS